ncbi:MAG: phage portal protein [Pseudomonadota bacterium]
MAAEKRSIENPATPLTPTELLKWLEGYTSDAALGVSPAKALRVPAFAAAVEFYSSAAASLPLEVYRRASDGDIVQKSGRMVSLLQGQVNDDLSTFDWLECGIIDMLSRPRGRFLSYIERGDNGTPINIFPMLARHTMVSREHGRIVYDYSPDNRSQSKRYDQADVIDICWRSDDLNLTASTPYESLRMTIGLAVALRNYAASYFKNGGLPPMQLVGNFKTEGGMERAQADMSEAVRKVAETGSQVLPVPLQHELKELGYNPKDGLLIEAEKYCVIEIARGFRLPPVFLQDLTDATYTNTEQQDLHLVKHSLRPFLSKIEAELNLKLFPRRTLGRKTHYVRFNMDNILRGDFITRMKGHQHAVNAGVYSPDDAAETEGFPRAGGLASQRHIQGATRPIDQPFDPKQAVRSEPDNPEDQHDAE